MNGIIYKATNTLIKENNVYIGATTNFPNRIKDHIRDAKRGVNRKFHKALIANNLMGFTWEIIDVFSNAEEGKAKETLYIEKYDSIINGYNDRPAGAGRPRLYITDEEIRQSKRDKALRWYYKSKTKSPDIVRDEEVIVEVPMDEEDDIMGNRASIIKSAISDKMKNVLRKKLSY